MKSIVLRIIGFYVRLNPGWVTVIPWDAKSVGVSPYAAVLEALDIPAVATVMNVIVHCGVVLP